MALKNPAVVVKLDELGAAIVPDTKLTPADLKCWLQQETAHYAPEIKAAMEKRILELHDSGARLLDGPAGAIEVLFDVPKTPVVGVAIVAHPQPLLGGHAMHKVPHLLARGLCDAGWLVARPNFRGVGRSAGTHDGGEGETEDLLALCRALRESHSGPRLALVGFSFGAYVQARVASRLAEEGEPAWRVALAGMPFGEVDGGRRYDTPRDVASALIVHGENDERVPLQAVLDWARPHSHPVVVVPGVDHFFSGRLPILRSLVLAHLRP